MTMSKKILSDEEIITGFRKGNPNIIHDYFYEYCLTGYHIYDQRYQLQGKENMDFYSLAHQYALYLISHDWKPLEDHSPGVSLRTWLINGFRYTVLDALKWHRKAYGDISYWDYVDAYNTDGELRMQFNQTIEEICEMAPLTDQDRTIIEMNLLKGYKVKEIAETLHITPSAVSQKLKHLKEELITPYFLKYFQPDTDMRLGAVCEDRYEEEPLLETFSYKDTSAFCPSTPAPQHFDISEDFLDDIQFCFGDSDEESDWSNDSLRMASGKDKYALPPVWEKVLRGEWNE